MRRGDYIIGTRLRVSVSVLSCVLLLLTGCVTRWQYNNPFLRLEPNKIYDHPILSLETNEKVAEVYFLRPLILICGEKFLQVGPNRNLVPATTVISVNGTKLLQLKPGTYTRVFIKPGH